MDWNRALGPNLVLQHSCLCFPPHLLLLLPFSKSLFIFSWRAVITAAPQPHRQNELFTLGHLPLAAVASLSFPIEPSRSSHTVTKTQPSATQSLPSPARSDSHPATRAPPQTPQSFISHVLPTTLLFLLFLVAACYSLDFLSSWGKSI